MIEQLGMALQEAQQAVNDKQAEAQLKMGELQVKAQTAQTQAEKNQYDAEIRAAELQLDRERLAAETAIEQQRLELERVRMMTEAQKQPDAKPIEREEALPANLGPNALQGYAIDKQAEAEQEARQDAIENELKANEIMVQKQGVEVQQQSMVVQQQNMAMLLEMLGAMKGSFDNLAVEIRAPKKIDLRRNPNTMLIEQGLIQ